MKKKKKKKRKENYKIISLVKKSFKRKKERKNHKFNLQPPKHTQYPVDYPHIIYGAEISFFFLTVSFSILFVLKEKENVNFTS